MWTWLTYPCPQRNLQWQRPQTAWQAKKSTLHDPALFRYRVQEAANYARLVERGQPDFIEIKAVTYCGTSKGSNLTMKNVPWHDDVLAYSQAICEATPFMREYYDVACEHITHTHTHAKHSVLQQ